MQILARDIDVISWFAKDGTPRPIRFKIVNEDESQTVIDIDKVLFKDLQKIPGTKDKILIFKCQSVINNANRIFELKYEFNSCKWMLYKM